MPWRGSPKWPRNKVSAVRPHLDEEDRIEIEDGCHPVVERLLPAGRFVPNDCTLDDRRRVLVVTGPNMGGKSTYCASGPGGGDGPGRILRSRPFGPHRHFGPDFSPGGSLDNLADGESTFMVEMTETANILHNATPKAWSSWTRSGGAPPPGTAWLWPGPWWKPFNDDPRLRPKALFATHYHELTELAAVLPRLANLAHRRPGTGARCDLPSPGRTRPLRPVLRQGIHVARLAGRPDTVVRRAREILDRLSRDCPQPASLVHREGPQQLMLFAAPPDPRESSVLRPFAAPIPTPYLPARLIPCCPP